MINTNNNYNLDKIENLNLSFLHQNNNLVVYDDYFFINTEPEMYFYLKKDEFGVIYIDLPDNIKQTSKSIYFFKNESNNRLLIGKTGSTITQRLSGYLNQINSDNFSNSEFIKDIQAHPEYFKFGIYPLKESDDLNFFEINFIDYKRQSGINLYNVNRGGAGGEARQNEIPCLYRFMQLTPEKRYPVQIVEGRIKVLLSPGCKAKMNEMYKQMISNQQAYQIYWYSFKAELSLRENKKESALEEVSDNSVLPSENLAKGVKRYIGTSNDPIRRSQEHCRAAERLSEEENLTDLKIKDKFHRTLAENPEAFTFGLIPVVYEGQIKDFEKSLDSFGECCFTATKIGEGEQILILLTDSYLNGLNSNKGGGGPIPNKIPNPSDNEQDDPSIPSSPVREPLGSPLISRKHNIRRVLSYG